MNKGIKLTAAGQAWALNHTNTMVARIALAPGNWPQTHVDTAVLACNKWARRDTKAA